MSDSDKKPTEQAGPAATTAALAAPAPAPRGPADISDEAFICVFQNERSFEAAQRMAKALSSSDIVPIAYQGIAKLGNCLVALEISQRNRIPVLTVMQNLHMIQGKPSWSAQYVIAALNTCGRFDPIELEWQGQEGNDDWGCRVVTRAKRTGRELRGTLVTIAMAKAEGWFGRSGSKWKTMPELMLTYRAASFFGKVNAPDILNGMQTREEEEDIIDIPGRPVLERAALPSAAPERLPDAPSSTQKPNTGVSKVTRRTKADIEKQGELTTDTTASGSETPAPKPAEQPAPAPEKPAEPKPVEEKKPEPATAPVETAAAAKPEDETIEEAPADKPKTHTVNVEKVTHGLKASNKEKVYILLVTGELEGKLFLEKTVYFIGEGKPDNVPTGGPIFVEVENRNEKLFVTGWRSQI